MAVELGVCAAYLTIGQLIRRAGLLSDSDTQVSHQSVQTPLRHDNVVVHARTTLSTFGWRRIWMTQVAQQIIEYGTLPSLLLLALSQSQFTGATVSAAGAASVACVALTSAVAW